MCSMDWRWRRRRRRRRSSHTPVGVAVTSIHNALTPALTIFMRGVVNNKLARARSWRRIVWRAQHLLSFSKYRRGCARQTRRRTSDFFQPVRKRSFTRRVSLVIWDPGSPYYQEYGDPCPYFTTWGPQFGGSPLYHDTRTGYRIINPKTLLWF